MAAPVGVATRTTNGGLSWLAGDHHGTGGIAINASTLSTTRRRLDPFGMDRGAPVSWPGEKGFVGGVQDPTGLTHLGAREYDPVLGRFTSVDPVFDTDDPQSMTGYAYCSSDPVNCVDADGNWGFKSFFTAVAKVADVVPTEPPRVSCTPPKLGRMARCEAGTTRRPKRRRSGCTRSTSGTTARRGRR